jgi:acyl-coenzyme A synthetase/AMP-(fatty) acid ligase
MNIVDLILFQCKLSPPAAAIGAPGTSLGLVSYGRLERFIHNISRACNSLGLGSGQIVAISVKDQIFHAAIVFALARLGVPTLSVHEARWPEEIQVVALISDGSFMPSVATRVIPADFSWTEGDGKSLRDTRQYSGSGDDLCRISLTSGTTGAAKAIALSHNMLLQRMGRFQYALGNRFPSATRLYSDLGVATAAGFIRALLMLSRGGTIFYYGATPEDTLQAFDLYKIDSMAAGPFALAEYLKFYEAHPNFPCSFDHIACLGGHLSQSLSERVRARMCSHLYSVYGSTEVSTVATAPAHVVSDIPGAVGYVVPDTSVEIVDPSGKTLPDGKNGIVRVRTPTNVNSYVGDAIGSAKAFRDGWFYPGDRGSLTPDGVLVISGREDATLNIGGDKLNPEAIETVLASFRDVAQAAVLTQKDALGIDQVIAFIVPKSTYDADAIRAHCRARLPNNLVPTRLIRVTALPRNETGKLDRGRLPALADTNSP